MPLEPSKEAVLVTYSLVLQEDGYLRSRVRNVDSGEFMKTANSLNKEWEAAPLIAKAIDYLMKRLTTVDEDLDKYLSGI